MWKERVNATKFFSDIRTCTMACVCPYLPVTHTHKEFDLQAVETSHVKDELVETRIRTETPGRIGKGERTVSRPDWQQSKLPLTKHLLCPFFFFHFV